LQVVAKFTVSGQFLRGRVRTLKYNKQTKKKYYDNKQVKISQLKKNKLASIQFQSMPNIPTAGCWAINDFVSFFFDRNSSLSVVHISGDSLTIYE
jgi:hypothetical protein